MRPWQSTEAKDIFDAGYSRVNVDLHLGKFELSAMN